MSFIAEKEINNKQRSKKNKNKIKQTKTPPRVILPEKFSAGRCCDGITVGRFI